jgi:hypothetical protein
MAMIIVDSVCNRMIPVASAGMDELTALMRHPSSAEDDANDMSAAALRDKRRWYRKTH